MPRSWSNLALTSLFSYISAFPKVRTSAQTSKTRFGTELDEETLNDSLQIILVAAELDPSTERILNDLNARDIAINVLCFQDFQQGTEQLLSRA
jgi:hypothetical protein